MSYWAWTRRKNFFIGFTIIKLLWPTSHRFFFSLSPCMYAASIRPCTFFIKLHRSLCMYWEASLCFGVSVSSFFYFQCRNNNKIEEKKFQWQKMFRSSVCRHEIGNVSLLLCKFPPLDCSNHDLSKNLYWSFLSAHALIKFCGNFL